MKVFVTGATGFIGSAIVKELIHAGHEVVGLARSEASAKSLIAVGARVLQGTIEDLDCLRRGAAAADGVIHTAFFHAFSHASVSMRLRVMFGGSPSSIVLRFMRAAVETDRRALETLGKALAGPDRPLVAAFGTMAMKPGRLATEEDTYDPHSVGALRGASEDTMRMLVSLGVRASVIRLPPVVHGEGDRAGFAPQLIQIARKKGESAYVGDGRNRWPAVHRLDAAHLFRLALEKGSAGATYHAVAEEGIPFQDIAEVIGRRLNVPVISRSLKEVSGRFSWLASFVANDNPTSSKLTQEWLGWLPTQPGLIPDLDRSGYFGA
jgi:nucleoside-diphosphate-sugar epimerase